MMTKFKLLLALLIFGYLGYFGWSSFFNKNSAGSASGSSAEDSSSLTPLERIYREIDLMMEKIFSPLGVPGSSHEPELKDLWERARAEFTAGNLPEDDARRMSEKITRLVEFAKERELFEQRLQESKNIKSSPLINGKTVEEKKVFTESEVRRQWREWVDLNRPATS